MSEEPRSWYYRGWGVAVTKKGKTTTTTTRLESTLRDAAFAVLLYGGCAINSIPSSPYSLLFLPSLSRTPRWFPPSLLILHFPYRPAILSLFLFVFRLIFFSFLHFIEFFFSFLFTLSLFSFIVIPHHDSDTTFWNVYSMIRNIT